jgi:hypothetical protein
MAADPPCQGEKKRSQPLLVTVSAFFFPEGGKNAATHRLWTILALL